MKLTPEQRAIVDLAIDLLACGEMNAAGPNGALTNAFHRLGFPDALEPFKVISSIVRLEEEVNGNSQLTETIDTRIARLRRLRGDSI